MDVESQFPRSFIVGEPSMLPYRQVELTLYKAGEVLRWEGYYRGRRISLYNNGYYWIVEAFWRGQVCGYFRHYKEIVKLEDVTQLVKAACGLIDIFTVDNFIE